MNTHLSFTEALSRCGLEAIDVVILLAYVTLLVSLSIVLSYNQENKNKSIKDYFLAGNTLTWWAVGTSFIAANISAEHFIGMAGTGYADGIAIAAYEIMAAITLLVIGKFLLPIMMEQNIFTFPQFLRKRYSNGVGLAFSILWLFLYIFVNLTSVAWLGALAIEQILGLQGYNITIAGITLSIRLIIVLGLFLVAGIYSIHGGMTSIAWTDVLQATFIIGGGLATAYFALRAMAGDDASFTRGCERLYTYFLNEDYDKGTHFHLVVQESRNPKAFSNVPGIAAIVGGLWLTNLCYWGFNQYITQKGLAAQNIREAQKGLLFAAFLKIIIPIIVLIPGICAFYAIQNDEYFRLQSSIQMSDEAYPWLIRNFIPTGIKGLSIVALVAAVLSSLGSMLNSTSTLFTIDIYQKYINPDATDQKLVNIGRIAAIIALIIAAIAVKPLLGELDQAFQYIQEYSGFIYPGITIVFCLGLFWKQASNSAAIWTAILTIPFGVLFKIFLPHVPFLFRAGYVFMILVIIFITLSLLSKKSVKSPTPEPTHHQLMMKWGYIFGSIAGLFILSAATVSIGSAFLPSDATPDNNIIAYLNDIGFQAFYFFGVLVGTCAMFLISNAKSTTEDPKALPIDFTLFRTTKGYAYTSLMICLISIILYIVLW